MAKAAKAAQPWCSRCKAPGPLEVHHVNPRSLDAGVEVLCLDCHRAVTAAARRKKGGAGARRERMPSAQNPRFANLYAAGSGPDPGFDDPPAVA